MILVLCLCGVSVILCIVNLALYHRSELKPIPHRAQRLTRYFMRPCCSKRRLDNVDSLHDTDDKPPQQKVLAWGAEQDGCHDADDVEVTWKVMAEVMDAVFLRIYAVVVVVLTLLFLILMVCGDQ